MKLGQKIKKLRELKNLSQSYVADKLNISQGNFSKIENSNSDIPYSKLEELATILGLTVEEILGFNEKMIFNLKNNKLANGLVINQISANEKKLYEDYIESLKIENTYLKSMIEKLLEKDKQ